MCIPYINYHSCPDPLYDESTIILLVFYSLSGLVVTLTTLYHFILRAPWKPIDYLVVPFTIHTIMFLWIRSWMLTDNSNEILDDINLILFFMAHLSIYSAGALMLFLWKQLADKSEHLTYITPCSISFILLNLLIIVPTLLISLLSVFFPYLLSFVWGYLGLCGIFLLLPFLYYGYFVYQTTKVNNPVIARRIFIMWIFMGLATPPVLSLLFLYAVRMTFIDETPWITTFIHLFLNICDNIIIWFMSVYHIINLNKSFFYREQDS